MRLFAAAILLLLVMIAIAGRRILRRGSNSENASSHSKVQVTGDHASSRQSDQDTGSSGAEINSSIAQSEGMEQDSSPAQSHAAESEKSTDRSDSAAWEENSEVRSTIEETIQEEGPLDCADDSKAKKKSEEVSSDGQPEARKGSDGKTGQSAPSEELKQSDRNPGTDNHVKDNGSEKPASQSGSRAESGSKANNSSQTESGSKPNNSTQTETTPENGELEEAELPIERLD